MKNFTKILVSFIAVAFCAINGYSQPCTSTWPLTTDNAPSVTGNISAGNASGGAGIGTIQYSSTNGIYANSFNSTSFDATDYFQYSLAPTTGNNLTILSVNFYYSVSSDAMNASVYYSLDNFSSSSQLGSDIIGFTNTSSNVQFTGATSITVNSGQTLTIRVYGWNSGGSTRTFRNKAFAVSGVSSCAAPSITGITPASGYGTGTYTIGATASAGTINWYTAPNGGSSIATGASFTTPAISSTTVYYVDATNAGCTTPYRTAVTATVNPAISLTNGNGITVSGTCPDFTISSLWAGSGNDATASFNGNLGIGTTGAPVEKVDVNGNINASGDVKVGDSLKLTGANSKITSASGTVNFGTNNLTTTGNVTANTVNATTLNVANTPVLDNLHVTHSIEVGTSIYISGTSGMTSLTNDIYTDNSGFPDLLIQSTSLYNNNTIINANNTGNVGVGKAPEPGIKLDVNGNCSLNEYTLFLKNSHHGVAYKDTFGTTTGINGPVLFGWGGGALGAKSGNTEKTVLQWKFEYDPDSIKYVPNVYMEGLKNSGGKTLVTVNPATGKLGVGALPDISNLCSAIHCGNNNNIGVGKSPVTDIKLDIDGNCAINGNTLYLHNSHHGLAYKDSFGGISGINGPVLFGWTGGALGQYFYRDSVSNSFEKVALRWEWDEITNKNNIYLPGLQPSANSKLLMIGTDGKLGTQEIPGCGEIYCNEGNVGIGINPSTGAKLEVDGDIYTRGNIMLEGSLDFLGDLYASYIIGNAQGTYGKLSLYATPFSQGTRILLYGVGNDETPGCIDIAAFRTYDDQDAESGKIKFYTAGSNDYSHDKPNMIIDNEGKVGIGTNAPQSKLQIENNGDVRITLKDASNSTGKSFQIEQDGDLVSFNDAGIKQIISMNLTSGSVGIGTTTPGSEYKLDVAGMIRSCDLIVETHWCDYVFDNGYKLMALKDLEKYLEENKHLPDVPSAKQIETNGLKVGEVNRQLMEKIEELTLYIIQLNKRIEDLEKSNNPQK